MKWKKFTLKTRAEVEDIVIATLADVGVQGVEIEDKQPLTEYDKQQMFVDILPDMPDDDGVAYLNFYLEPEEDKEKILADVREALEELREFMDLGECTIMESETEDKDWINNWKTYFKQFYVDDILIIPSWEEVKEKDRDKMVIHIDPGTAFGTGIHDDFDISKLRYDKIVLMTDADVDGAHITTLILTFIYRYMPELIKQGHVFLAKPPLYKLTRNKKDYYAYSDQELASIQAKLGAGRGKDLIQRYKGLGEMDPEQLWETTMDPDRRILRIVDYDEMRAAETDGLFMTLMGESVVPRRRYIEDNAQYADVDA